jgi:hypothetical protein
MGSDKNQIKPAAAIAKWGGTDCEETTNDNAM